MENTCCPFGNGVRKSPALDAAGGNVYISVMTAASQHARVVIIGSGPAGLTAAIYAARAALEPWLIEGTVDRPLNDLPAGGQLMITTDVENYPGFPKGILGPELMEQFRNQAQRFGTQIIEGNVTRVELGQPPFRVTYDGGEVTCDALVISTGASAKLLNIESETRLMGYGVSACATCDGPLFRGVPLVVVGGGDSAMEEATFLTKFATKVFVVHRRDTLRASKIMQERAFSNPKIEMVWNSDIEEILSPVDKKSVIGVRVRNVIDGTTKVIECGGVFVAIGHKPNSDLFKDHLRMDDRGYIWVEPGTTRTSVAGVFACGDVTDHVYRQAVTAAGTGCMAALDAERYLSHSRSEVVGKAVQATVEKVSAQLTGKGA